MGRDTAGKRGRVSVWWMKEEKMGATLSLSRRPFKRCHVCEFVWQSPADFLNDPHLRCIGYQRGSKSRDTGLMLFNHTCGTTLAIKPEAKTSASYGLKQAGSGMRKERRHLR